MILSEVMSLLVSFWPTILGAFFVFLFFTIDDFAGVIYDFCDRCCYLVCCFFDELFKKE